MSIPKTKAAKSWIMYDWANSAFATTVMAGFFPVFFKSYWSLGQDPTVTTAKLGFVIGTSSLLIAILSPLLGALSDLRGLKKTFCFIAMLIACACCLWMAFIPSGGWEQAMWAYGIAMLMFASSIVFYDSLLPSLASDQEIDELSSRGYAWGYLGGGVLFAINVLMYLQPALFGLTDGVQAVRFAFASVALWWIGFSIPLWRNVPEPSKKGSTVSFFETLQKTFAGLRVTVRDIWADKNLRLSLLAFWLYIDGVYTVMTMAVDYGMAIGLDSSHLIAALLLVQFVGFPSTWLFGHWASRWGCRLPMLFCIAAYAIAVVAATWMSESWHFYLLAGLIGSVQGGVQALSRSLFGKMIPTDRSGEYFGFYNLIGRFAAILGPFIVAFTVLLTRESRSGMLGLLILFAVGGLLLWKVKEPGLRVSGSR